MARSKRSKTCEQCGNVFHPSHTGARGHAQRFCSSACAVLRPSPHRIDITGQRFGRLVALSLVPRQQRRSKISHWLCRCNCGRTPIVALNNLRGDTAKSCGCAKGDWVRERAKAYGAYVDGQETPEHLAWMRILDRCYNRNNPSFKNYGGRGILVCDRWRHDYRAFLADMGRRPSVEYSIDRIDNDGPYAPENCRWATDITQANNSRKNRHVTIDGELLTIAEAARKFNVLYTSFWRRIKVGDSPEVAVAALRLAGSRQRRR